MKVLIVDKAGLVAAERWDIDFHLPPEGIKQFDGELLQRVDAVANIIKTTRDPSLKPEETFLYIDIASIDVDTGTIRQPQELTGDEAPSRARKVVHAYDIIISTVRPTRGAIAVVPENLHGQICSTGFSVIRPKEGVNPYYLHFALRLPSTLEQFRKWSTGSSYPAILDDDVAKTLLPIPAAESQDAMSKVIRVATAERDRIVSEAQKAWGSALGSVVTSLQDGSAIESPGVTSDVVYSVKDIAERRSQLDAVEEELLSVEEDLAIQESLLDGTEDFNE